MNRRTCNGCVHRRPISTNHVTACHYILDTGLPRGCPPENCTKKSPIGGNRNRLKTILTSLIIRHKKGFVKYE